MYVVSTLARFNGFPNAVTDATDYDGTTNGWSSVSRRAEWIFGGNVCLSGEEEFIEG